MASPRIETPPLDVEDFRRLGVRPNEYRVSVIRTAALRSSKSLAKSQLHSPSEQTERQLSRVVTSAYRLMDPRLRANPHQRAYVGRILPMALHSAGSTRFSTTATREPQPVTPAGDALPAGGRGLAADPIIDELAADLATVSAMESLFHPDDASVGGGDEAAGHELWRLTLSDEDLLSTSPISRQFRRARHRATRHFFKPWFLFSALGLTVGGLMGWLSLQAKDSQTRPDQPEATLAAENAKTHDQPARSLPAGAAVSAGPPIEPVKTIQQELTDLPQAAPEIAPPRPQELVQLVDSTTGGENIPASPTVLDPVVVDLPAPTAAELIVEADSAQSSPSQGPLLTPLAPLINRQPAVEIPAGNPAITDTDLVSASATPVNREDSRYLADPFPSVGVANENGDDDDEDNASETVSSISVGELSGELSLDQGQFNAQVLYENGFLITARMLRGICDRSEHDLVGGTLVLAGQFEFERDAKLKVELASSSVGSPDVLQQVAIDGQPIDAAAGSATAMIDLSQGQHTIVWKVQFADTFSVKANTAELGARITWLDSADQQPQRVTFSSAPAQDESEDALKIIFRKSGSR